MSNDPECLIVFDYHGDRRFWSGRRWVADASDAEVYRGAAAMSAFRTRVAKANLRDGEAFLVENYGLDSERIASGVGSAWLKERP